MAAPSARGLFAKAVAESAYMTSAPELRTTGHDLYSGEAIGLSLASPAADMIKSIPATWDETVVLPPSEISEIASDERAKDPASEASLSHARASPWHAGAPEAAASVAAEVDERRAAAR